LDDVLETIFVSLADRTSPHTKSLLKILNMVVSILSQKNSLSYSIFTHERNAKDSETLRDFFIKKLNDKKREIQLNFDKSFDSTSAREFFLNYHNKQQQDFETDSQQSEHKTENEASINSEEIEGTSYTSL
jgi:lipopolysaccharide export LptBFGC system permease protein LptF